MGGAFEIVRAACACGYQEDVVVNVLGVEPDGWPAACRSCGRIVGSRGPSEAPTCSRCAEPVMPLPRDLFPTGERVSAVQACPRCEQPALTLELIFWID